MSDLGLIRTQFDVAPLFRPDLGTTVIVFRVLALSQITPSGYGVPIPHANRPVPDESLPIAEPPHEIPLNPWLQQGQHR